MFDVKEIRSVKIVPYTVMTSTISAILAFIGALIMILLLGIVAAILPPQFAPYVNLITGAGIAIIVLYPVGTFLIGILTGFLSILFYNILVPRIGGIKLGMNGDEIENIPVIPFALITSLIIAIWAFIFGLIIAALIPLLTGIISTAALTGAVPASAALGNIGMASIIGAIILIIGLPIIAFIFSFIAYAVIALVYNYITVRVSRMKLELSRIRDSWFSIESIPVLPAALTISITFAIYQFIFSIPQAITSMAQGAAFEGIIGLIVGIIINLIIYFIMTALGAFFYNFLAPKIDTIKLTLE
ncbi:hypothetical protein [Methanobacterium sp. ACI-7]|uniref:hypothetical protein n=1 Tax=unclassified Methanobacterium TaxID=2627676 RepID=UPI0039C108DF